MRGESFMKISSVTNIKIVIFERIKNINTVLELVHYTISIEVFLTLKESYYSYEAEQSSLHSHEVIALAIYFMVQSNGGR